MTKKKSWDDQKLAKWTRVHVTPPEGVKVSGFCHVVPGTVDGVKWVPRVIEPHRTTGISPQKPQSPGLDWNQESIAGVNPRL